MSNPVCWFEIYVDDMERAKRFYESVFQVSLEKLNTPLEMWRFAGDANSYGIHGALVKMDGCDAGGHGTIVYFACADCAVEAARIAAADGRVVREKMSVGEYGHIVLALDTEGNMIGLHSLK
jgi:uncharacterized protein